MKKKLFAGFLASVLILSLCACGGSNQPESVAEDTSVAKTEETDTKEEKAEEADAKEEKHQAGDIVGQWKCTAITMDELGTMDSEECKELLGYDMLATISFSGWETGHCAFSMIEENEEGEEETNELAMLWTKETDSYVLTFENPEATASYSGATAVFEGETLILTLKSAAGAGSGS